MNGFLCVFLFLLLLLCAPLGTFAQDIVLRFGENSMRIERDQEEQAVGKPQGTSSHIRRRGKRHCAGSQCLDPYYDKMALPPNDGPIQVHTSFELRDVINIDDEKFTITFSMYFGVRWKEPRLKNFDNTTIPNWLAIDLDFVNNLWLPNVFIYDLKEFKTIHVLHKLAALFVVKEGEVFYQQSTHVTFLCAMRFEDYPLDSHVCKFRVGSSSHNDQKMKFQTENIEYDPESQNTILDYKVEVTPLEENDTMLLYGDMGNYSIGGFQFKFKRHMGKYVWNYHFPSGLFVVVSWVSFLINPTVVPGRMGLLVTLFLVLTNMFNSINASSPIVEGMTSIGIWLLSCIMFVFGAVSEYAVILFLKRKMEDRTHCHNGSALHASTLNMNKDKWEQWAISLANKIPSNDRDIARVDRIALIFFASAFCLFNLCYWSSILKK